MKEAAASLLKLLTTAQREPEPAETVPEILKRRVDVSLTDKGLGTEALEGILEKVFQCTPDVGSPFYMNYFYAAPDPVGLLGDWVAAAVNTNVHAFEASPFFSLAETEVVRALGPTLGWDGASCDGIFCPGGSYSNMLAVYISRTRAVPESVCRGLSGQRRPVIFVSEQAHYSFDRAAALLGLGTEAVIKVGCDSKGRMDPHDLKRRIDLALDQGELPLVVCATLGTTVLGAFDPLTKIREVLDAYPGIRLHVDAAWGGAVFMSEEYARLGKGIEAADSVTWDFHKALGAPILCSVLMVRDETDLKNMFNDDTSYIFHGAEDTEGCMNLGEKTPQCGRRADAFKLWLMWKIKGKDHFKIEVEKRFRIRAKIIQALSAREAFYLLDEAPDYWNICFWYVPPRLRNKRGRFSDTEQAMISRLTAALHDRLKKEARIEINYAGLSGMPDFLRLVINSARLDDARIKALVDTIEFTGEKICTEMASA